MPAERPQKPAEIEEREQQRLAVELAGLGTWSCDSREHFAASVEAERMLGLPESRGCHPYAAWQALIHPDDRAGVVAGIEAALHGEGEYGAEYRVLHPARGLRWIVSRGRLVPDPDGRRRVVGVVRDVTESRSAAAEIRQLNERLASRVAELQAVLDVAPVAIALAHDAECRSITVNAAGARLLGVAEGVNASMSAPGSAALPFRVLRDGRELAPEDMPMQHAARHGVEVRDVEVELVRDDGERLGLTLYAAPLYAATGAVRGAVGMFVDTTERRRAESRLRASEGRLRRLIDGLAAFVGVLTPGGILVEANRAPLEAAGLTLAEVYGRPFWDCPWWSYDADVQAEVRAACSLASRGETVRRDLEMRMRGESRVAVEFMIAPLGDEHGTVTHLIASGVDVTERVQMERRLRDADRRKDEFLAMLAHELRNPLAPIRTAAQYLRRTAPPATPADRAAEVIERQALQMTRLVDDLLDVSRITRGRIELKRADVDLRAAVAEAVERAQPLLDARGHRFTVELPSAPVVVHGDPVRLAQVVDNLLTNAAKYTEPGGAVALTVTADEATAEIAVRDDGVGIPADLLPHVFDLFVQSDRSLARSEGGLGIGLSVVKRLVQMHGGTVAAESAGPGRGARFAIGLPLARGPAVRTGADASAGSAGSAGNGVAAAGRVAVPASRVLVVDDNRDCAESLAMLLRCDGHDARVALGANEALAEAFAFAPHTVLLDIGLPGMDGYEVARRLRADPATAGCRLVALTGYGQASDRERALQAGFDRHVVKPVDPSLLAELVGPP